MREIYNTRSVPNATKLSRKSAQLRALGSFSDRSRQPWPPAIMVLLYDTFNQQEATDGCVRSGFIARAARR